jgi:hypothetical protein
MLEKMRHAASEQAKRAADAAGEHARHAAEAAQRGALAATDRAGEAAAKGIDRAVVAAKDPANQARAAVAARSAAKGAAKGAGVTAKATAKGAGQVATGAGKAVKSALDKLNPDLLAAVVMKATSLQEQANATLKKSGSLYRISGIAIGAAFPPSVTFQIGRLSDVGVSDAHEMIEQPENAFLEVPDIPDIPGIATSDGAG